MAQRINLNRVRARLRNLGRDILKDAAREAVNFSKESFRKQGWTDNGLSPWKQRKTKNRSDKRTTAKRAILVDTGALRRSIRVAAVTSLRARVVAETVYAKRHNQGLASMPQRKFLGESREQSVRFRKVIAKHFKGIFK